MYALHRALDEWRRVLPSEAVLEGDRLDRYRANCLGIEREIPAALRPTCEEQVVEIVRIAHNHRVPLYTFSTGHNWGYGTSLPAVDSCVLVDLSGMNRIVAMDEELGLVTVEPGVTQRQLFDYLAAGKLNYFVPTTGAGPTASILGNALERGFGMTPEKDHFTAVHSVRAVLADGRIYQPYMSEIGAGVADGVYKWGIGPYLDGLFTQGSFGIVTAMQISLVRRPEHTEVYVFTIKDEERFFRVIESSREMLADLRGPIGSIKYINQPQVEMTTGTRKLGAGLNLDFAWMGFGVMHTQRSMVRAMRRSIRKALRPHVSRLVFMNDARLRTLKRIYSWLPGPLRGPLTQPVEKFQELLDIIHGVPRGLELRLVYRHVPFNPQALPLDPVHDGVGVIWYAPVIPMRLDIVTSMTRMIKETLAEHGFPPAMSMTTLSEKCAMGVIPVIYKRESEAEKAHGCFADLRQRGMEIGCHPYRINIAAMPDMMQDRDSTYWSMVAALKAAVDPYGILSPGRYARVQAKTMAAG